MKDKEPKWLGEYNIFCYLREIGCMVIFKQRINIVLLNNKYKRSFFIFIKILQSVFDAIKLTHSNEQRSKWEEYKAKKETARDYLLKQSATNERNLGNTTTLNYTDEEKQDRLNVYTVSKDGITLDKAVKLIKRIRMKNEYKNRETGDTAFLSVKGANKIICNKAVEKSMNNGFTKKQHNEVASKIGELYEYAFLLEKIADRNNDSNILSIKRYVAPIIIGNDIAGAYITVKELKPSKKEKIVYTRLKK